MKLPKIGDIITTETALRLCQHFGLNYLAARILWAPENYEAWKFDGCSGVPDELLGLFTGCKWEDITFKCCLPHDLKYAYGEPGNNMERKRVDTKFQYDLVVKAGMAEWLSDIFFTAVRVGGKEKFGNSFSWAYASKKR